jgi:hypothetical protein
VIPLQFPYHPVFVYLRNSLLWVSSLFLYAFGNMQPRVEDVKNCADAPVGCGLIWSAVERLQLDSAIRRG